jgi:serine/threonine-protein kinase
MRTCPQCTASCDDAHKFCPSCGFPVAKVAANTDDPLIGRTLPGGYVILDLVGIGGMGRVYRAEQTNLGRTVAVKIIHPHLVGEENAAARFITEARAASRLNHPNSVAVIDFGKTQDGQLYLVMEFLRGKDLARVMYEEGPLSFRRIVNILRQVLAALAEAHHMGIIHRDLKPENIILEPMRSGGDFVKVVDFGLAKMREAAPSPSITSPGIVCGTPEYMSPEQGRGDELDARSDLYGVGVIFYQLLTGKLPFEADSPTQVVLMHISEAPKDPRQVVPERRIPAGLVDVCLMALAKEPAHRFSDADEFGEALGDALNQVEVSGITRAPVGGLKCASCGAFNPTTQKYCGECGAAIVSPSPRATLQPSAGAPPASEPPTSKAPVPAAGRPPAPLEGGPLKFPLPLLGREEDLAWLDERRRDAKTSLIGARLVGDVGMGKTRLLEEFTKQAASAGDVVVSTGPDPSWAEVGYRTLREAIVELAKLPADGGDAKDWRGANAEARRGLEEILDSDRSMQGQKRLRPEDQRYAAAEALRWALARAAERANGNRVVLAVDDMQSIDGASRNALSDVVSEPPLVPALLVVAYVPGFDPEWPSNTTSARVIVGLPPQQVTRLFAATNTPSYPGLSNMRGIQPLYLEQLLRFSREQGGAAPGRLADLIAMRVERMPPDARRVLQAVSVYGDDATLSTIKALVTEGTDMNAALQHLTGNGMIVQKPGGVYATAHPLLREVVAATIPAAVRRGLHASALEVGESSRMPLEARALHAYHAHDTFQALILLESVATRSAARGDYPGQVTALRRCLELARRELFRGELDDPMRAVLIFARKLGEALAYVGDYTDAEGVLREALDMAGPNGQDRARVLGALAHVAHGRDRRQEARIYLREALELATKSGAHDLMSSLEDLKRAIA